MPYRVNPSKKRKLTDDSLVEYYTGDYYSGTTLMTLKEAKRRDREERIIKIIGNAIAMIIMLLIIAAVYFINYWIPINLFHAQPIVCFGCR